MGVTGIKLATYADADTSVVRVDFTESGMRGKLTPSKIKGLVGEHADSGGRHLSSMPDYKPEQTTFSSLEK